MADTVECIVCKGTGKLPKVNSAADWGSCLVHVLVAGCFSLVAAGLMLDRGVPGLVVMGAAPILGVVVSHLLGWMRRGWRWVSGKVGRG